MNIDAYLNRIRYDGPTDPTRDTLHALHQAHLLAIPFENLDIHAGRPIRVDRARIYDKIVGGEKRGGWCYELNGLFSWLLESLGFRVTLLSARPWRSDGSLAQPFAHLALRVDLDEPWLADVGFGEAFRLPLRLVADVEQAQRMGTYRLSRDGDRWIYARLSDDGWINEYRFMMTARRYEEFGAMCHWQQTAPESGFVQQRVYTLATPDGRITVNDKRVTITRNGVREETPHTGDAAFWAAMHTQFGVARSAINGQP